MARRKSFIHARLEYYPIRVLYELLKRLPLTWSEWLSGAILKTLMWFMPRRRKIMQDNLALCFPAMDKSQRDAIARQSVRNLARGLARYPRLPDLCRRPSHSQEWVRLEGFKRLEGALQKGRGVLFFTAHFGFWEALAVYVARFYPGVAVVARPQDNPLLEKLVTGVRASGGGAVIHSHRLLKEGIGHLRNNGILGTLIDQNFYKGGLFVDFFGRPAATTTIVSWLARRTGSVVLAAHSCWEGGVLRLVCEGPFPLSQNPDTHRAVAEDTQAMTKIVEGWIRQDPGQWLWLHNRWKRRPEPVISRKG